MKSKPVIGKLSLSMLISACATESNLIINSEPVEPIAVGRSQTLQTDATPNVVAETKLVEVKAVAEPANEQTVSRLAAAPDFYHCLVNLVRCNAGNQDSLDRCRQAVRH